MSAHSTLSDFAIRYNAWRDRRTGSPAPDAEVLGEMERRIVSAGNTTALLAQRDTIQTGERLASELRRDDTLLNRIDRPGLAYHCDRAGGRLQPRMVINGPMRLLLMAVVTISEFFFNAQAFGVFGEAAWQTWLMALAVGLSLPAIAEVLAHELRLIEDWRLRHRLAWGTLVVVVFMTLAGINTVRAEYLQRLGNGGAFSAASTTDAFLAINAFLFLAAVGICYFAMDPEPGLPLAAARYAARDERATEARVQLNQLAEALHGEVSKAQDVSLGTLSRYRRLRRRAGAPVPAYFDDVNHPEHEPRHRFLEIPARRFDVAAGER